MRTLLAVGSLALGLATSGCSGLADEPAGPDAGCAVPNTAPEAPTVIAPIAVRAVVPGELLITASAFADPDGDAALASELEIWMVSGDQLSARIWRATVDGGGVTVALADGAFEPGYTRLFEWTDYAVRVRHLDDAECSLPSPWSEPRHFRTDDGSAILFDEGVIRDVYLDIPPASWEGINDEALPGECVPYQRNYYTAALTFEGQTYGGIGVKVKGGCGSARTLDGKPGLKINLNWDDPAVPGCPDSRRIYGQNHLTLNNQVQDRSAAHERLGYRLYRAMGVPVPRAAPVRVHINGALFGLYLHVETVGRRFLSHRFDDHRGMLYEGTYWCDLIPDNVPADGDDTGCLSREFAPSVCSPQAPDYDLQDYPLLRTFVGQIAALPEGGFYPEIEAYFEFDTFLSQWAVESVMSHWDAYTFSIMNNYRVYHDPSTGRWTMIPTGIDQTFEGDQDPWGAAGVLGRRCLDEPDCEAAFAARLLEVSAVFESLQLGPVAQGIRNQISAEVAADPRKEYSVQQFDESHDGLQEYMAGRRNRIVQHLQAHGF